MSLHREEHIDWKKEYGAIMRHFGFDPFANEGKRATPRIRLNPPEKVVLVHIESLTGVFCDLSAGGVSFFLNVQLTAGRLINLDIDKKFRVRVKVVGSTLDDHTVSGFRDTYRNGTKFLDDSDGYRCMVQSLQLLSRSLHF